MSFRGPLFRKPVTGQGFFFAVSYSKSTLANKVSWLKALLCSMSTVQSYLTSEAFLLAFQPVYAVRIKRKDLKSAVPAQLNWVSQMVSYCKGTIKRRKSI